MIKVNLQGLNKEAGFNITNSSGLLKGATIGSTFKIDNVKFTYSTDPTSIESKIFRLQSGDYYDTVEVTNCNISGHIRVVQCISGDFDPTSVNFGIDKIRVTDNIFNDAIIMLINKKVFI